MKSRIRAITMLAALAGTSVACADSTSPVPEAPSVPYVVPSFPAVTRPATVYEGGQITSRYVLYVDGTFSFQLPGTDAAGWTGRYTRAGSVITFEWDGSRSVAPWAATGTLDGEKLMVRYNEIMQEISFVDGTYVRVATIS